MELFILDVIQELRSPLLDSFFVTITRLGDAGLIWIGIALALVVFKKTRSLGIIVILALSFSLLITNGLLKNIFQRPRPFNYRSLMLLIERPNDFSFPSGHTSASFALAFVFIRQKVTFKKIAVYKYVILLACLMAFSRMYLYVHYPSDILGAICIAYLCSRLSENTYNRFFKKP